MSYNGRTVIARAAASHGWTVLDPIKLTELEFVTYAKGGTEVEIGWTVENTARAIVRRIDGNEEYATGRLGLITARRWLES